MSTQDESHSAYAADYMPGRWRQRGGKICSSQEPAGPEARMGREGWRHDTKRNDNIRQKKHDSDKERKENDGDDDKWNSVRKKLMDK